MGPEQFADQYLNGPEILRAAVSGLTRDQLDATPVAGQWSIREVICHLADFEIIAADHIKRVLAEENPALSGFSPGAFHQALFGAERDVDLELSLIEVTRGHVGQMIRRMPLEDLQRTAVHSEFGVLTLETLLESVIRHIPHHIKFIEEKRRVLMPSGST